MVYLEFPLFESSLSLKIERKEQDIAKNCYGWARQQYSKL